MRYKEREIYILKFTWHTLHTCWICLWTSWWALPIEVFKCASAVYYALTDVIFQYYFLMMSPDYLGFFRTRSDVIYCLKISTSWHWLKYCLYFSQCLYKIRLSVLFLVSVFSQSFFTLMRRYLMTFSFFTARHILNFYK